MGSAECAAWILVPVAVLGGAALIGFLLFRRRALWGESLRPGCWFGFPYAFGAVACVLGLVAPEPEWREPMHEGGPPFAIVVGATGFGLLLLGAIIHFALWRRGRLTGNRDGRLEPQLAVALAVATAGFQWLTHRGVNVGLWLTLLCGGLLVVALTLWVVISYLQARNAPAGRIARLVASGRPADAIELGEAIPPEERDPCVQCNLGAAYCETGDLDRAEALFAEARTRPDLHEGFRKMSDEWMERIAREKASRGTGNDDGSTVGG